MYFSLLLLKVASILIDISVMPNLNYFQILKYNVYNMVNVHIPEKSIETLQ